MLALPSPVSINRARLIHAMDQTVSLNRYCFKCFAGAVEAVKNDERGDLLSISSDKPDRASYAGHICHQHNLTKRINCTFQKYFRRAFSGEYSDSTLDEFVAQIVVRIVPIDFGFEVVRGPELESAYKDGPRSCMSHDNSEKVRLWAVNPDKVGLLILRDGGKIVGRCLLWSAVHVSSDHTYYELNKYADRVYCSSSTGRVRYDRLIADRYQPLPSRLQLSMVDSDNDLYPYADSMRYAWRDDEKLVVSTYAPNGVDHGYLNNTDGSLDVPTCCCAECGDACHEDESHLIDGDNYCESCVSDNFTYLGYRGEYVRDDDIGTDIHGEPIADDDVVAICEHCENAIGENDSFDTVYDSSNSTQTICENCLDNVSTFNCPCCDRLVLIE